MRGRLRLYYRWSYGFNYGATGSIRLRLYSMELRVQLGLYSMELPTCSIIKEPIICNMPYVREPALCLEERG